MTRNERPTRPPTGYRPYAARLTACALAVGLLLSACGAASSSSATRAQAGVTNKAKVLTVGDLAAPSSLDPQVGTNGSDYPYLYLIYARLIDFKPNLSLTPGLARSWGFTGPSKLTFFLKLRRGAKFQDGTPVNAAAVKFSLDRYVKLGVEGDLTTAQVSSITTAGQYEVLIHLRKPYSILPQVLSDRAGMIVSPAAVKKYGKAFASHPVGAGPFSFVSEVAGASVTLRKFQGYYDAPAINLSGVKFTIYPNGTALVDAMKTGLEKLELLVPPVDVKTLRATRGIKVNVGPSLLFDNITLNQSQYPFKNEKVREAMSYALNREALNQVYTEGLGQVAWEAVPPGNPYYDSAITPIWPYNPSMARRLLAEAGYSHGVNVTCIEMTPGLGYSALAPVIVSEEGAAGIHITIRALDPAEANDEFLKEKVAPCLFVGWSGRPSPLLTYTELYGASSLYNPSGAAPAGVSGPLTAAYASYTVAGQKAQLDKVNAALKKSTFILPEMYVPDIVAMSSSVRNYIPNDQGKDNLSTISLTSGS